LQYSGYKKNPTTNLAFVTLWNINFRKQAINGKLQPSVATYLSCGEVVDNQIKKGLLLSLLVIFKSVNIWRSYQQERGCLVQFVRLASTLLKDDESDETTIFVQLTLPNTHRFKKKSLADSSINVKI